ncbi:MAG: hypothetical protein PHO56_05240 [Patescibacteria group bacterium]|nr:hypothetical protein [Patescibacteria group bacterium]
MKNLIIFLVIALLSVGCSRTSNPVMSNRSGTAVGKVSIILAKPGVLRKTLASGTFDYIILQCSSGFKDTIKLIGRDTATVLLGNLVKGNAYELDADVRNDSLPGYILNGGFLNFTVPNADTFPLLMNLPAKVEKFSLSVPLKGSPAQNSACSLSVSYVGEYWQPLVPITKTIHFSPGTFDTITYNGMLGLDLPTENYTITVCVFDTDGTFYKGSGSAIIKASTDASLNIVLAKYLANAAVAVGTIILNSPGKFSITASFK